MAGREEVRRTPIMLYERECDVAGQDPVKVARLARRLRAVAADCQELGITIFGGAHSGDLRAPEGNKQRGVHDRLLILASVPGPFDGGDGGASEDADGLLRGE